MDFSKFSDDDAIKLSQGKFDELSDDGAKLADSMNLDTETGGSYKARAVVGSRQGPLDKMTALQKYYPGAKAIDENFVFDNPETGRPTLFNPPGADFGDVAGGLPEIAEAVGGTIGGVGGSRIGGFKGGVAGAGALASFAREGMIDAITGLSGAPDTRTGMGDMAETAALNAAGQAALPLVGSILAPIGRGLVQAGRRVATSPAVLEAAERMGVSLPAGVATGKAGTVGLENMVGTYPSASTAIADKYATGQEQLGAAAKKLSEKIGPAGTKQEAGSALKSGADKAMKNFEETQKKLYDTAFDKIGPETPVKLNNVMTLEMETFKSIDKAPKSLAPTLGKSNDAMKALLEDAYKGTGEKGTIHFDTLRQVRTNIGRMLKNPQLMVSNGMDDSTMRALYGAISKDIEAAAGAVGPDAAKALKTADRYTRYNLSVNAPALDKVVEAGSDEAAFNYAMGAAKDGGTRLRALRRNMPKEQWDTVSATVFENLGRSAPGAQGATAIEELAENWSANTFLTNWNKMAPEARKALFAGKNLDKPLNDLMIVSERFKKAMAQNNFSNTAKAAVPALAALGIGGQIGEGDYGGAAKMAAGAVIAPRMAAKLLTNPEFVTWLVKGSALPTAKAWTGHISRLAGVSKRASDSETADALNQYRDILQKEGDKK